MKPPVLTALLFFAALAAAEEASPEKANWWAFQPLTHVAVPRLAADPQPANSIDAFIRAKLAENGLAPSPEADPRTLIRRLSFDLTGLPPTPAEVEAFADSSHQSHVSYEHLVDSLLASPRHGERWARHWMDAAHFAETHGNDQDRIRENAWPYRDYLIAAFNADKPYARFVEEQVAGDVLFPNDPQATVALGFLSAGPWDESSLRDIREDTRDRQIARYLDRDDMLTTVMATFTSTTVHCARCHDHKFDPIPQRDYYALQAVFAGVDRANRAYDADPQIHARRQHLLRLKSAAERGDRAILLAAETQRDLVDFERTIAAREVAWRVIEPQTFVSTSGATLTRQADNSLLASGPVSERDVYTITATLPPGDLTAVRLEVLADDSLPHHGPGRQSNNGNLHLSEFQVLAFEPGANAARELALANPSADFNQDQWTIAHALDRNEKTAWGIHPREGEAHRAVFELKEKLHVASGTTLTFVLKQLHGEGHLIGRLRLAVTDAATPVLAGVPPEIATILASTTRTDDQRASLTAFLLKEKIPRDIAALPAPSLVYVAASEFEPDAGLKPSGGPRPIFRLHRGDITQPREAAEPGALSCLAALPPRFANTADEGARRAALAHWLTAPENALTWRSIVNRVWHLHFGRGLVATPNDFGHMGAVPSHPELLDWLAVWFRDEAHGSLKALHRLIVTSATYRQGSARAPRAGFGASPKPLAAIEAAPGGAPVATREARALPDDPDPDNILLARMNRTRLDAESIRDTVLAISGQLDLRAGGPSDRQFDLQPGIHVTPRVDYAKFDVNSTAGRRRSVYRFLFRTLPDPFMDALDCPAGDQLAPARNASVTVQQALALWNSAFLTRHAELFAERVQQSAPALDGQIKTACALALGRAPTPAEQTEFTAYAQQHGLANLCRVILNSNEFVFLN